MDQRQLIGVAGNTELIRAFLAIEHQSELRAVKEMSITGIGPIQTEVGDLVVVFDGFATPMVLRPVKKLPEDRLLTLTTLCVKNGKSFQVISNAYFIQLANVT